MLACHDECVIVCIRECDRVHVCECVHGCVCVTCARERVCGCMCAVRPGGKSEVQANFRRLAEQKIPKSDWQFFQT